MTSESKDLFTITEAHLDTGLRGFPVGTAGTSKVDPQEGVSYCGYSIAELVTLEPEAVIFLLFHKSLPTADELAAFSADLKSRRGLPASTLAVVQGLPKEGHPMEWLMAGLVATGMTSRTGDWKEDALNLVARVPELVAAIFRVRSGWGDPIPSDPSLSLIDDFVHMLDVPGGDPERLRAVLRTFYILHMDHGGGNLSTFTGKAVASGHADIFASLTAAMAALYGSAPRPGEPGLPRTSSAPSAPRMSPRSRSSCATASPTEGKIYGFGHAVLRAEDPRATIQYALGQEICPDDPLFRTARPAQGRGEGALGHREGLQPVPERRCRQRHAAQRRGPHRLQLLHGALRSLPHHGHRRPDHRRARARPQRQAACRSTVPSSSRATSPSAASTTDSLRRGRTTSATCTCCRRGTGSRSRGLEPRPPGTSGVPHERVSHSRPHERHPDHRWTPTARSSCRTTPSSPSSRATASVPTSGPPPCACFDAAVDKAYGGDRKDRVARGLRRREGPRQVRRVAPQDTLDHIETYKIGIKGPLTTPVGGGIRSLNVAIRQRLDLYACVRPVRWFQGVPSPVKKPEPRRHGDLPRELGRHLRGHRVGRRAPTT